MSRDRFPRSTCGHNKPDGKLCDRRAMVRFLLEKTRLYRCADHAGELRTHLKTGAHGDWLEQAL